MKNTLSFSLLFSLALFCWQNTGAQTLSVGAYAGTNVSDQTYEIISTALTIDPTDPKIGLSAGGYVILHLTQHLGLRADVQFSRQGSQFRDINFTDENGNAIGSGNVNMNFDYLQVPLMVELSGGQGLRWFVDAGYGFNFLLGTNEKGWERPAGSGGSSAFTQNISETDYSFVGGLGLRMALTERLSFTLEGRANIGLNDVHETTILEVKNRSHAALAGVAYGF